MLAYNTFCFLILHDVLTRMQCNEAITALARVHSSLAGSRNLLNEVWCQQLAIAVRRDQPIEALSPKRNVAVM